MNQSQGTRYKKAKVDDGSDAQVSWVIEGSPALKPNRYWLQVLGQQ